MEQEDLQQTYNALLDRAELLVGEGRFDEAEAICRDVLARSPDNLEAIFLMATIHFARREWAKAAELFRIACRLEPGLGFLHMNLALALQELGMFDEALTALHEAGRLDGPTTGLHFNRGVLFQRTGRFQEARREFEHALARDTRHLGSWTNLTAVCLATDDISGAIHACRHGLHLDPANPALTANLATAYGKAFRFEESMAWYRRLLELIPPEETAEVLGRMANCYSDLWMTDEAIACFDRAIAASESRDQRRALASTRLFVLHYSPRWSTQAIAAEHRAWGRLYFPPPVRHPFPNNPDPDRRIRIAYLSPDLRIHAVVFFLQPVLAAHDPSRVEVYCYSDVKRPDAVTRQIREQHGVVWRDCSPMDDDELLRLIRQDGIDILVDLAGHTALNRLPLFARRAAPVQITWIGYPNTTGLEEIDYRITDHWADPPGMTEHLHAEQLLRLPDSFLCYRPGGDFPEVGDLPLLSNGHITFGSFSNFMKVTPAMLEIWALILASVPDSHLIFRARGLSDARFRGEIAPLFSRHGVDPARITVLGHARSVVENLLDYHRIDIALDTFPYHGTTTTCESLHMGVPVVTMAGDAHVSRVGVSLLHTAGLPELIAESPAHYRRLATELAGDEAGLRELRATLRARIASSPLTDNVRFTSHLEALYRQAWRQWCGKGRT